MTTREDRREARTRELTRGNPNLTRVVERNIRRIAQLRRIADESRGIQDRMADAVTGFAGSMLFVYLNVAFFMAWIWGNMAAGRRAIDQFPYPLLTLVVSLEAIMLSVFVLVSQNRMQSNADDRDDLDLHVDLLSEYEITRSLRLIKAMAEKMGIEEAEDPELEELGQAIKPGKILKEMGSQSTPSQQPPKE